MLRAVRLPAHITGDDALLEGVAGATRVLLPPLPRVVLGAVRGVLPGVLLREVVGPMLSMLLPVLRSVQLSPARTRPVATAEAAARLRTRGSGIVRGCYGGGSGESS